MNDVDVLKNGIISVEIAFFFFRIFMQKGENNG